MSARDVAAIGTGSAASRRRWAAVACAWSVVFAAPHLYWAVGGRWGLGGQAPAADEAFAQPWFFAYNLVATGLALAGGAVAIVAAWDSAPPLARRLARAAAWAACLALGLRGAVGLALLGADLARGTMDSPLVLVAVEFWFALGCVVFGAVAVGAGRAAKASP